jgi:hypothetical protein
MNLIFEHLVTSNKAAFLQKVRDVAAKLSVDPNWLMAVMYKESRLNHKAVNSKGGATGLIQFMPATANGLGTSTAALLNMSNLDQLDYVHAFYRPYRNRIKSYVDMYKATFLPISLGKPDDWVFQYPGVSAQTVASQNPIINRNENGVITVATFTAYCYKDFSQEIVDILKKNFQ